MSPASRDDVDRVPRVSWVSCALALACLLGLVFARAEARDVEAAVNGHLASAEDYFRARPYLKLPALLEGRVDREAAERAREGFLEKLRSRGAPPIPPRIQAREQEELGRMLASAEREFAALPAQVWGVRATERAPETFFGHVLFHGGWLHLAGNLALLLVLGRRLQGAWGAAVFACVVVAVSLGAAAAFVLHNPGFSEPYIGTSGLVAGLAGALLVHFALERGIGPALPTVVFSGLVLVLPTWLGWDWSLARGLHSAQAAPAGWSPSLWAVVGGFITGTVASFVVWLVASRGAGRQAGASRDPRRGRAHAKLERALEERRAGRFEQAERRLAAIVREDPDDLAASLALWDVANDLGRPRAALSAMLRVIRDDVGRADSASAVAHWLELVACELDADAKPTLLLRMAPLLREAGEREAAARCLRNALAGSEEPGASLASRVAREASALDPQLAEQAAWRALGSLEIDLEERQSLEQLLEDISPQLAPATGLEHDTSGPGPVTSRADLEPPGTSAQPSEPSPRDPRPDPIDFEASSRDLELRVALPMGFDGEGLRIELAGGSKKRVRFDRIGAVAVAAVEGLGPRAVILVDIVLNWPSPIAEPLQVVRLRTDRFDPRRLAGGVEEPLEAVRALVAHLLEASAATPLPDLQSAQGMPFAAFPSLSAYQRVVLMVDGEA